LHRCAVNDDAVLVPFNKIRQLLISYTTTIATHINWKPV